MPTLSIDFTAPQADRLQTVVGKILGLRNPDESLRQATLIETRAYVIRMIKQAVLENELEAARVAIQTPPFDVV